MFDDATLLFHHTTRSTNERFFFVPAFGGRVAKAAVVDLVVDIV
jgi:hypothetical protein